LRAFVLIFRHWNMHTLLVKDSGFPVNLTGAKLGAYIATFAQILINGYHEIYHFFYNYSCDILNNCC
jgi:hypothetical protein